MKDLETLLDTCCVRVDGYPLDFYIRETGSDEIELHYTDNSGSECVAVVMADIEIETSNGVFTLLYREPTGEYNDDWVSMYFFTETPVVNLPQRDTFKAKG